MPLTNFGAILTFAETLEREDMEFYGKAEAAAPAPQRDVFTALAKEGKKNLSLVQRTRRENVTEMILEPIRDFTRDSYRATAPEAGDLDLADLLEAAAALENRAIRYYTDAAQKIRALPEVSRALKTLAKKRGKRLERIESLES